jgi:hypothetical protein
MHVTYIEDKPAQYTITTLFHLFDIIYLHVYLI